MPVAVPVASGLVLRHCVGRRVVGKRGRWLSALEPVRVWQRRKPETMGSTAVLQVGRQFFLRGGTAYWRQYMPRADGAGAGLFAGAKRYPGRTHRWWVGGIRQWLRQESCTFGLKRGLSVEG